MVSVFAALQLAEIAFSPDEHAAVRALYPVCACASAAFDAVSWHAVQHEWRSALCLVAPLGVLPLPYALALAWRLLSFEDCGQRTLRACPDYSLNRSAVENCLACGWDEGTLRCLEPDCGGPLIELPQLHQLTPHTIHRQQEIWLPYEQQPAYRR